MSTKGFSLIEVNLAILIAIGGLLSMYTLFPVGMRQNEMSSEDLYQATFASSVFQMISGNVATISNVDEWNDPKKFWKKASKDTGLETDLLTYSSAFQKFSSGIKDKYLDQRYDGHFDESDYVWYVTSKGSISSSGSENVEQGGESKPAVPSQYLLRIFKKRGSDPAQYVISFISTSDADPNAIYFNNVPYVMEFSFYGKVWAKPVAKEETDK